MAVIPLLSSPILSKAYNSGIFSITLVKNPIINDLNANLYLKVFDIIKVMGYEKLIEGLSPLEIVVVLLKFVFVYKRPSKCY